MPPDTLASPVIRIATPEDVGALQQFLDALDASRTPRGFDAESLLPPRGTLEVGAPGGGRVLVAVPAGRAGGRPVGAAAWGTLDRGVAGAALVIADGWRASDLGERLAAALAGDARAAGIERFVIDVVPHNAALRAGLRRLGLRESRHAEEGVVRVVVELGSPRPGASD
jgi:GNAT superfamily N-acetyltransferase